MDDGCGVIVALAGILIVVGIVIALVVYVVIPLSGLLLLSIAVAGMGSGAVIAARNFGQVLIEAHKNEK